MNDQYWMRRTLALARKGWGTTSPNPMVGAILVRDNEQVSCGWHQRAGTDHAEIIAIKKAGEKASLSTLYVNLEPCSSYGRTPPCVDAIVGAGIRRVVIGTADPNPQHAGNGLDFLRRQGIEVVTPVESSKCDDLNEAFFCWIRYGRPYVVLKLAMTVDGRIATRNGQSQWITGPISRNKVQKLRQWADAVMVGGETIRCDNPGLLVRRPKGWRDQPLRIVVSRSGNLGVSPNVLTDKRSETEIVAFESIGDWQAYFRTLGQRQITALLVEGGGEIAGQLIEYGLVDKVCIFIAPKILGGRNSRAAVAGNDPASLADATDLKNVRIKRSGEDFLLTGYLTDVHRVH